MDNVQVLVENGIAVALVHDCNALCGDNVRRMLLRRSIHLDSRWTVTGPDERASLDPSIECEACGLHGYWRDGAWIAV